MECQCKTLVHWQCEPGECVCVWYAAAAGKHLVSRGQPVVTSVTGESRSTGSFNLPTNIFGQTDADTSERKRKTNRRWPIYGSKRHPKNTHGKIWTGSSSVQGNTQPMFGGVLFSLFLIYFFISISPHIIILHSI